MNKKKILFFFVSIFFVLIVLEIILYMRLQRGNSSPLISSDSPILGERILAPLSKWNPHFYTPSPVETVWLGPIRIERNVMYRQLQCPYKIWIRNKMETQENPYTICGQLEHIIRIYGEKDGKQTPLSIDEIHDGDMVRFTWANDAQKSLDAPPLYMTLVKLMP